MSTPVSYQLQDSIAVVSMDDGKANVMSCAMQEALAAALDHAQADGAAAVLLSGRPGTFSAGFDLKGLAAGGEPALRMLRGGFRLAERVLRSPVPVVAACSGHAIAMGVFLLLATDYRIGAEGAFRIGANEVAIGMTVPYAGIELCRQRLAPAHFSRAVINAEMYAPADAVTAGFLDRVVPPDQLQHVAMETARQLTRLDLASHRATKLAARAPTLLALELALAKDDAVFETLAAGVSSN